MEELRSLGYEITPPPADTVLDPADIRAAAQEQSDLADEEFSRVPDWEPSIDPTIRTGRS